MSSTFRLSDNKKATTPPKELAEEDGQLASAPDQETAEEVTDTNAAFLKRLSQVLGCLSESDREILLNAAQRIVKT